MDQNSEMPGMLGILEGVAGQRWPHSIDARIWTREWLKTIKDNPDIATDEGAMIGWFANAIMAARLIRLPHMDRLCVDR